jgi:PAS domain S-box-containing protein
MHSRIHDYIGKVLMLADTIPSLVSYFDTAQRYIFANQRYEDWFAIPPEAMIGKHISDVFGHKTYKTMKPHLERAVQGERVTYEGVLEDAPGGARWFRATHVPHKDAANAVIGVCSLVYDITPMKRQQEKLQRTIAAAEESNRAKSDFLASTSHELRTPLNAIIGFSEILMQEVFGSVGGAQNKEYIADIHGAANHLLGVINNILDLAKVESGKLALNDQRISMHQIVHSSMRMVEQRAAEKHLHLTRDEKASFPDVFVDDRLIRQVLTNVLVNAVKFTPDGGHVSVSGALQDDGALVVSVVDTGIGIAEADLLSVLEPFVQSDHAGVAVERGTGLGLPLAVSFMRLHGGLLRLDSVKGTGTTVEIVIPSQRVLAVSSGQ